ncbi:hypothetical protein BDM02DRAFT_3094049 [Thelephora ganbajun]|uniref:Uncharacterized protein n=1 Tax=Thelephora ganbajun TaxID=370292 RepID=A0ACB6ZK83_THEGA|nr:hypothetical protein BDM02DRAFT_3094049 [Thelephora ganbajun]
MTTPQHPIRSIIYDCPQELLEAVCTHIFYAGIPSFTTSLDPLIGAPNPPTALPNSFPAASWTDHTVRKTLASLCLVNKVWYDAAKPWLWRRLEVRLPRSWLCLVDELAGGADGEAEAEATARVVEKSLQDAQNAALAARSIFTKDADQDTAEKLHSDIMAHLDGSVPPELLSPPASRDPSPWRLRDKSKSPTRWRMLRSISDAVQNVMSLEEPGIYVPPVYDRRPGRFVRHIDFNHFRTIGMRRSVEEGVTSRFVTAERLEVILKEAPNLKTFGGTEYMDGALNLAVIKELFLRGNASLPGRGRVVRPRFDVVSEEDIEERERRRECVELEAMDFTGCISAVFVNALTEFVNTFLITPNESDDEDSRGRYGRFGEEPLIFPSLQRLCLRGAKSIPSNILNHFVLALPSLTHLDLSATRVTPEVLATLGSSGRMHLHSLALAKCIRLTGQSICNFLIDSPAARELKELNLYGDNTFFTPLSADELSDLVRRAPCFTKGELEYLDISSTPLSPAILDVFPAQPKLRSLGLSFMPSLPLDAIAKFLRTKADKVEVLTLISTSPDLGYGPGTGINPRQASIALHSKMIRPLSTPPFSFSVASPAGGSGKAPTNLRVVELAAPMLSGLGGGAGTWRIIRSKGGRGWYVDTASGWCAGELRRELKDHPWREELQRLSDANGNVSSGVGWHSRKMEVLHGHGMFGREDGLYGAVSFAYQG